MASAELIAKLKRKSIEITLRIKELNGYLKNLAAVIDIFTTFSPKEIALNAINKEPQKIWTKSEMIDELRRTHNERKLDTKGLENKTYEQISRNVLDNLLRTNILERVDRGQYRKTKYKVLFDDAVKAMLDTPPHPHKKPTPKKKPPQKESTSKTSEPIPNGSGKETNDIDKHERYRRSQISKGLCIKCNRPATSKTLCDYHRQKKRESNIQQGQILRR